MVLIHRECTQFFKYLNLLLDIITMSILKVISLPGNVQNVVKERSPSLYTGFSLSIGSLSPLRCVIFQTEVVQPYKVTSMTSIIS